MPLQSDLIKFRRTDQVDQKLEALALEFADHFSVKREYLKDFGSMITQSKRWKINNLNSRLSSWSESFRKRESRDNIINLVNKAFKSCEDDNEISILRGLLVESILIGVNGGSKILNNTSSYGWGAKVIVNREGHEAEEIYYYCTESSEKRGLSCGNRGSVDFGFWDGYHGKFYECKASPDAIGCKEINYMGDLRKTLSEYDISHETFFVSIEDKESVKMRLDQYNCSPLIKPLGIKELIAMIA